MRNIRTSIVVVVLLGVVLVTPRDALARENTGFLRINNYDREDYSFRIDTHSKNILMIEGTSQALPILVRAGGSVRVVVKDNYYCLRLLAGNRTLRLRVKDDHTTTLTLKRGGISGYDLVGEVSRRGSVRSRVILREVPIAVSHTPAVIIQQPAPVVVMPQPQYRAPVVIQQPAPIIVYPAPCPAPVIVQPPYWTHPYYENYYGRGTHYRYRSYGQYRGYSSPHRKIRLGGISLTFGH